jgi:hypothetical protein
VLAVPLSLRTFSSPWWIDMKITLTQVSTAVIDSVSAEQLATISTSTNLVTVSQAAKVHQLQDCNPISSSAILSGCLSPTTHTSLHFYIRSTRNDGGLTA